MTFSKAVPFSLPTSCPAGTVSGCTSVQRMEQQDRDVGRGFLAAEGCQQQIITNLNHRVCINTKLLHQITVCALATRSLGLAVKTLLTAALSPVQVPPWASTHAWGMNRARLRGTFLNKTRGDIKLCILFCVFPYGVWWFGICQS